LSHQEYYETIKKLDQFTLDYISKKIVELEMKNFREYENKIEFARGRDDAYRTCARIFSDIYNHRKMILKK